MIEELLGLHLMWVLIALSKVLSSELRRLVECQSLVVLKHVLTFLTKLKILLLLLLRKGGECWFCEGVVLGLLLRKCSWLETTLVVLLKLILRLRPKIEVEFLLVLTS